MLSSVVRSVRGVQSFARSFATAPGPRSGFLHIFGDNDNGQCGVGTTDRVVRPTAVAHRPVLDCALGAAHTLAVVAPSAPGTSTNISEDENSVSLFAWGRSSEGQLGTGASGIAVDSPVPVPVAVDASSPVVAVACGDWHSLALAADGSLRTFGYLGSPVFGTGGLGVDRAKAPRAWSSHLSRSQCVPVATEVAGGFRGEEGGLDGIIGLAAGRYHSFAVTKAGRVFSWGKSDYGVLGQGTSFDVHEPQPIPFFDDLIAGAGGDASDRVVSVSSGPSHAAAVTAAGHVYLWGRNTDSQLGFAHDALLGGQQFDAVSTPRLKKIESGPVAKVACGGSVTACLSETGLVHWWGNRVASTFRTAVFPSTAGPIVDISCGKDFFLAVDEAGSLFYWGKKSRPLGLAASVEPYKVPLPVGMFVTSCAARNKTVSLLCTNNHL